MADSFGSIIYIDSESSITNRLNNFGTPIIYSIGPGNNNFGAPLVASNIYQTLNIFGPPVYFTTSSFINGLSLFTAGNLIQAADSSNLNIDSLTLADKTGTGCMIVQPPSNFSSYQFKGMRLMTENQSGNYTIPAHKSGYIWTNNDAAAITITLPTGAPAGFMAYIVRSGGVVSVKPPITEKIELGTNETVISSGIAVNMASSGSVLGLIKDDGTRWTRFISFGTIT